MFKLEEIDYTKPVDEWLKQIDKNWETLMRVDKQARDNGQLLGRYIDHPFADGKAVYVIVQDNKDSVRIQVCTGLGDGWVLPAWGHESIIPRETALKFTQGRDKLNELFGRE